MVQASPDHIDAKQGQPWSILRWETIKEVQGRGCYANAGEDKPLPFVSCLETPRGLPYFACHLMALYRHAGDKEIPPHPTAARAEIYPSAWEKIVPVEEGRALELLHLILVRVAST